MSSIIECTVPSSMLIYLSSPPNSNTMSKHNFAMTLRSLLEAPTYSQSISLEKPLMNSWILNP